MYRRLLIQSEAAGIPTRAPITNFVAEVQVRHRKVWLSKALTDVAPNGCYVEGVAVPNDRVDELDETSKSSPKHVDACPSIPSLKVPR